MPIYTQLTWERIVCCSAPLFYQDWTSLDFLEVANLVLLIHQADILLKRNIFYFTVGRQKQMCPHPLINFNATENLGEGVPDAIAALRLASGLAHGDAGLGGAHPASELIALLQQRLAGQGSRGTCGSGRHSCTTWRRSCGAISKTSVCRKELLYWRVQEHVELYTATEIAIGITIGRKEIWWPMRRLVDPTGSTSDRSSAIGLCGILDFSICR